MPLVCRNISLWIRLQPDNWFIASHSLVLLHSDVHFALFVCPGPFCEDLYETIIQMTNGPVIWAYLKPLIMGKILYSPDTPFTRMLIEKVELCDGINFI